MLQQNPGTHIVEWRKACGLTQPRWAKVVVGGCSVEVISLVERGASTPSVGGSENYANGLVVEIADLFRCLRQERVRRPSRQ